MARPAVAFVVQQHELSCLQRALKRSIRWAACRVYALQVCTDRTEWALHLCRQPVGDDFGLSHESFVSYFD